MIAAGLERAVGLMATGRYGEAVAMLDQMLEYLRSYFLTQEATLANFDSDSSNESLAAPSVEAFVGPICVASCFQDSPRTSEYPIYERAMLVRGFDEASWKSEVNVAIITASILYNKGLVFHILGQSDATVPASGAYIARARLLYEKALSLTNTCSPSASDNFWLKSVLLNNLGQICAFMCDRPGEQVYLMDMDKLLCHRLDQDEIKGEEADLKLNVILLIGNHRPSPAA